MDPAQSADPDGALPAKAEGSPLKDGKVNERVKEWTQPIVVLRVLSLLASLAVVCAGFYVWVMKVDNRSHENAKAVEANRSALGLTRDSLKVLSEEMREEHEITRKEIREQMVVIGQKIMQLELRQAVIKTHDESVASDLSEIESIVHSHIREGAHAQADQRLKALEQSTERRFEIDDRAREALSNRLREIERNGDQNRRQILDLPNRGQY